MVSYGRFRFREFDTIAAKHCLLRAACCVLPSIITSGPATNLLYTLPTAKLLLPLAFARATALKGGAREGRDPAEADHRVAAAEGLAPAPDGPSRNRRLVLVE